MICWSILDFTMKCRPIAYSLSCSTLLHTRAEARGQIASLNMEESVSTQLMPLEKASNSANRDAWIANVDGKWCFIPHEVVARAEFWRGQLIDYTSCQNGATSLNISVLPNTSILVFFFPVLFFLTLSNQASWMAEFSTSPKPNVFIGSRFLAATFKGVWLNQNHQSTFTVSKKILWKSQLSFFSLSPKSDALEQSFNFSPYPASKSYIHL